MKCPYCRKPVRDMPTHLETHKECLDKHTEKIKEDLIRGLHGNRRFSLDAL